jgi:hypothetical protein
VTAATLLALAAETERETLRITGVTEQARLRGLTTETFGLTHHQDHLIAKLRNMPADLLATIRDTGKDNT